MRVHPAFFHKEAIIVKNRFLAMLLAMLTIVSLAACGQKSDAAIEEINSFISENLSADITSDEHYEYGHGILFLRKEVMQPHLPMRLPCYDFTPVIRPAFGGSFLR